MCNIILWFCFNVHRQDWGAILLIDERFNKSSKYTNGILLFYHVFCYFIMYTFRS